MFDLVRGYARRADACRLKGDAAGYRYFAAICNAMIERGLL
jgi:hypothetical protein